MGLDSYLIGKKYIGMKEKDALKVTGISTLFNLPTDNIGTVEVELMYWRKANHIHKWFVDNVQEGIDDCGEYYVTQDNLIDLRNKCNHVLNNPKTAKGTLPTVNGFFFGGTEYDEYYFSDLKATVEGITKIFDNWDDSISICYTASW